MTNWLISDLAIRCTCWTSHSEKQFAISMTGAIDIETLVAVSFKNFHGRTSLLSALVSREDRHSAVPLYSVAPHTSFEASRPRRETGG